MTVLTNKNMFRVYVQTWWEMEDEQGAGECYLSAKLIMPADDKGNRPEALIAGLWDYDKEDMPRLQKAYLIDYDEDDKGFVKAFDEFVKEWKRYAEKYGMDFSYDEEIVSLRSDGVYICVWNTREEDYE